MVAKRFVILGFITAAMLAGCAQPGLGGGNYTRAQVRGEQSVRFGAVESVRDVVIDARNTGTGTLAGAAIGGVAGSTVGGGSRANAVGAIAGMERFGQVGISADEPGNFFERVVVVAVVEPMFEL